MEFSYQTPVKKGASGSTVGRETHEHTLSMTRAQLIPTDIYFWGPTNFECQKKIFLQNQINVVQYCVKW